MGRKDKARKDFEASIALIEQTFFRGYSYPYQSMARLLLEDSPKGALRFALKSVEVQPKLKNTHILLGEIHWRLGQFRKAAEAFEDATYLDPEDFRLHYWLHLLYQRLGKKKASKMAPGGISTVESVRERSPATCHASGHSLEFLDNHPEFSGPAGHPLPVQVFQQRNGVLAGNIGQLLEGRDIDAVFLLLVLPQLLLDLFDGVRVEEQGLAHPDQLLLAGQQGHQPPGLLPREGDFPDDLLDRGNLQTRLAEGLLNSVQSPGLVRTQANPGAFEPHSIPVQLDLIPVTQVGQHRSEHVLGKAGEQAGMELLPREPPPTAAGAAGSPG